MECALPSELAQKIYNNLLESLYTGEIQPGDLINRREIARTCSVSVTPVLEALTRLEMEGFLETLPRRGTRIRPITAELICDSFMLRDALEVKAARLYYRRLSGDIQKDLLAEAERVDSATARNFDDWKIEIDFHRRLVALSDSTALLDAYRNHMHLFLFYGMQKIIPVTRQIPRDNHTRLVRELTASGSAEKAGDIIRAHVWYGKEYILEATGRAAEEL